MELRDKRIVLVGASSGIGSALALRLAGEGARLVLLARRAEALEQVAREVRERGADVETLTVDAGDRDDVARAHAVIAAGGVIDGLIYNAGVSHASIWGQLSVDDTKQLFEVNFFGFLYWLEHVLPAMRERRGGFLAATTAMCAYRGIPSGGEYAATKGALGNLVEGLRLDLEPFGIRVFQLMPGLVRTPMAELNNSKLPLSISADKAARIIVRGLRRNRTRIEFGWAIKRMFRLIRALSDRLYSAMARGWVRSRATMERMILDIMPPMVCPEHGTPLVFDRYASLVCSDAACDTRFTLLEDRFDILDAQARGTDRDEKVKLAYRFYSMVYPVTALFALWIVWRGSVRSQVRFYRERIDDAADDGLFLDVATGDGSMTKLALRRSARPPMIAVDLSTNMLRKAAKKLGRHPDRLFVICDIGTLSYAPRSFRHILCFGGLHVFSDPLAALRHMHELLADDGVLSGSYLLRPGTPRRDNFCEWAIDKGLLSSAYTDEQLDALVAEAGFVYTRREPSGRLLMFSLRKAGAPGAALAAAPDDTEPPAPDDTEPPAPEASA